MNRVGSSLMMLDSSRPLASAGEPGITTCRPGTCANHACRLLVCYGPWPQPLPPTSRPLYSRVTAYSKWSRPRLGLPALEDGRDAAGEVIDHVGVFAGPIVGQDAAKVGELRALGGGDRGMDLGIGLALEPLEV